MESYRGVADLEAAVGQEVGPTEWFTVDQARIDGFADDTEDYQWIHVDPERAAAGPFGTTVAHGYLTLSLVSHFMSQLRRIDGARMGINYGLNKVRFPAPVQVDARIRARATLISVDRVGDDAVQVVNRVTIEIEGGAKPACVADVVSRYYFDVPAPEVSGTATAQ
jgi:acyl dehydratase